MLGNKRDYTLWNKRGYTSSLERTTFESAAKSSPRTSFLERADTECKTSAFLLQEVFWSPHMKWTSMFASIWVLFHGNVVYLQLSALVLGHLIPSYNPYMHILPYFLIPPEESRYSYHTTILLSLFNLKMSKSKWRKERSNWFGSKQTGESCSL